MNCYVVFSFDFYWNFNVLKTETGCEILRLTTRHEEFLKLEQDIWWGRGLSISEHRSLANIEDLLAS